LAAVWVCRYEGLVQLLGKLGAALKSLPNAEDRATVEAEGEVVTQLQKVRALPHNAMLCAYNCACGGAAVN